MEWDTFQGSNPETKRAGLKFNWNSWRFSVGFMGWRIQDGAPGYFDEPPRGYMINLMLFEVL